MARNDPQDADSGAKGDRVGELNRTIDEYLGDIEMLRVAYERYFTGVDRSPPAKLHEQLRRRTRHLGSEKLLNTEQKFRVNSAKARFQSNQQYWNRILRLIDDGKFDRVMTEASQKRRVREALAKAPEKAPSLPRSGPAVPGQAPLPPGIDAKEARRLFKELVTAKRALGESTRGMTYGSLVNSLARELPKLQKTHGPGVRFVVTTRNGQVKLSARKVKASG